MVTPDLMYPVFRLRLESCHVYSYANTSVVATVGAVPGTGSGKVTTLMKIGTTIRAHRLQKGLSQGDIEKKTGLLRCYLSRVENGHTVPSRSIFPSLSSSQKIPSTAT